MGFDLPPEYVELGRFVGSLLDRVVREIRPGVKLLDVAESIESEIREAGYEPAFPVNLSINEVAAHYTPPPGDDAVVPEGALLKVDVGARLGGLIVDAARTVDLSGSYGSLVEAARAALEAAGRAMAPGVPVKAVSRAIYNEIRSRGLQPIVNLAGHKISEYKLHAGVDVPNVPQRLSLYKFRVGDVFAVEPFVTTPEGSGFVVEARPGYIFSYAKNVRTSDVAERRVMAAARDTFKRLPFCERWLIPITGMRVEYAIRRLVKKRGLREYPPLVESRGAPVAQWEDTYVVTESGALPLTRGG